MKKKAKSANKLITESEKMKREYVSTLDKKLKQLKEDNKAKRQAQKDLRIEQATCQDIEEKYIQLNEEYEEYKKSQPVENVIVEKTITTKVIREL